MLKRFSTSSLFNTVIIRSILTASTLLFLFTSIQCTSKTNGLKKGSILNGKVIGITDGDTFKLLVDSHEQKKIRLYGIDCPERNQPFGTAAKKELSELIFGKEVSVQFITLDKWKRVVGMVYQDEKNINEAMLEKGFAWHFKRYDNNEAWDVIEKNARLNNLGLWVDGNSIAPWDWRKTERNPIRKQ